jgi:peptidyl-prolyl cis-trans isomerase C
VTDGQTLASTHAAGRSGRCARLLREPLFVFLLAGTALFAAHAWVEQRARPAVTLSAETRARLVAEFESVVGRQASEAERIRLERDYLAEELLAREAIENDVHLTDPGVRARLVEAVRRRIAVEVPEPTDEDVVNHYAEHLDLYRSESTVDFAQVYFRDTPPPEVLERLQAGEPVRGDEAAQGTVFPDYGESMIRGLFGEAFLAALQAAPLDAWSGPYESPSGWHYLRPTARRPGVLLAFDEVRDQVADDYTAAAIEQAVDAHVAGLHERYEVQVEDGSPTP